MIRRRHFTLADFDVDGQPRCFHCDKRLPKTTVVERAGNFIVARCSCGLLTPFPIKAGQRP
jgi:hypothetical protein